MSDQTRLRTIGYWERVEQVRDAHFCENRIAITPGIGDPRVVGWVACGDCNTCRVRRVAERDEAVGEMREPPISNYSRAVEILDKLYAARAVSRELKTAFAKHGQLDGGARAAADHPLYLEAVAEEKRWHEALMELI